nr:hypothetical protein [Tanacetum cinerariifolium]
SGPNLQTRHPAERFVISSDSSHHSSTNAADDEFTSIVRSFASPPPIMTVAVAATTVAGTSTAPALGAGTELVHARIFNDSASIGEAGQDVTDPSNPAKLELSVDTFYGIGYEQLFAKFNVRVARQACFSVEVRLRYEHNYRKRKKFERKCQRHINLLKEKDAEIASWKAELSL